MSEVVNPFSEVGNLVGESATPSATFAEWVDDFAQLVGNSANLVATRSQVVATLVVSGSETLVVPKKRIKMVNK